MKKLKILIIEPEPDKYFRVVKNLQQKHDVEFAISCNAILNRMQQHEKDGGLNYYDVIIMEPYFNPYPLFDYYETEDAMQTGYFLYDKYMRELTTKVIIFTYPTKQYQYGPGNFPDRHWGLNVSIHEKYRMFNDDQYLIKMVEDPQMNQPMFTDKK